MDSIQQRDPFAKDTLLIIPVTILLKLYWFLKEKEKQKAAIEHHLCIDCIGRKVSVKID